MKEKSILNHLNAFLPLSHGAWPIYGLRTKGTIGHFHKRTKCWFFWIKKTPDPDQGHILVCLWYLYLPIRKVSDLRCWAEKRPYPDSSFCEIKWTQNGDFYQLTMYYHALMALKREIKWERKCKNSHSAKLNGRESYWIYSIFDSVPSIIQ